MGLEVRASSPHSQSFHGKRCHFQQRIRRRRKGKVIRWGLKNKIWVESCHYHGVSQHFWPDCIKGKRFLPQRVKQQRSCQYYIFSPEKHIRSWQSDWIAPRAKYMAPRACDDDSMHRIKGQAYLSWCTSSSRSGLKRRIASFENTEQKVKRS